MFRLLFLLLILLLPAAAKAEWKEATSRHFVVYSEGSEESLREAITKLEKYDFVLRWASRIVKPSSAIKLRVFMLPTPRQLQATMYQGGGAVLGYYTVEARGPVAFALRYDPMKGLGAQEVLFHEYAHHLMFQYHPAAYPAWFTEGFAEFYGTTRIGDDDVVEVGHAALVRYRSFDEWLPLKRMLTSRRSSDLSEHWASLYAQGWLLVHYLVNSPHRNGQLEKYLAAINSGQSYEAATNLAFGPDAKELDLELRKYSRKRAVTALRIPFRPIDVGPIKIRTLNAAEQALIDEEMKLSRGLLRLEAQDFASKVRRTAQRFPHDPYALSMLVEAERAVGNHSAAAAAVERWIAAEPQSARALMHKAQLQIEALQASSSTDAAAWNAARAMLLEAHKKAPIDPLILVAYYDSFSNASGLPPPAAQNALFRAHELVPQDENIRYRLALDFEHRNMIEQAIEVIKPAAYAAHNSESEREKKEREKLEDKYRDVNEARRETPAEMMSRLEQKLAGPAAETK